MSALPDTIAAIATPPGRGGVGIVRISGPGAKAVATALLGECPAPRYAHYTAFKDATGTTLDRGIALYFAAPHSFTGEDVLELQGHGGPIILDMLLQTCIAAGARQARPGEFSERAFLNDKIDLLQAEAIADLIDAGSKQAAQQAVNTLTGAFSIAVNELLRTLTRLRVYIEAAIDFPEEEVDFLADGQLREDLEQVREQLRYTLQRAEQGCVVREGMSVVLAGRPNAGKSSLMNALAGEEVAIVTTIPGTTRDILRREIQLDGLPLHLSDTAGLRHSEDLVEREGIDRARLELNRADCILLLIDSSEADAEQQKTQWRTLLVPTEINEAMVAKITLVMTKIDRRALSTAASDSLSEQTEPTASLSLPELQISAKTGAGLDELTRHLKARMNYQTEGASVFSARQRHLQALVHAQEHLDAAALQLASGQGELAAEDLRLAQDRLGEITGRFSADDLLGEIFGGFCIGK